MEESSFSTWREDSVVFPLSWAGGVARLLVLCGALVSFVGLAHEVRAEKVQKLSVSVEESFQVQNFEEVIAILEPVMKDASNLTLRQRVRFFEKLGSCYWLTDQKELARTTFARLWQDSVDHKLDELVYPVQLIEFYDNERRRLKSLGFIGKPRASPSLKPDDDGKGPKIRVKTITLNRAPSLAYWMPFGVGQFANDERGLGTAIAVLQGLGVLGNVATWISVEALKVGGSMPPERAGQAELLQGLWIGSTAVLVAAYAYSVIDGLMSRPPERLVTEEDSAGLNLRLEPASQGLGIGLGGRF